MRAADFIVASLKAHGVKRVYCVPGESYLALLDALYNSGIEVIVCRHEGGAGFMAMADAKLSGKPAVLLVSRGPGATNASIAVHSAEQDGVPLIVMIGQVARDERTREVFQEVDYRRFFGGMAKGIFEVTEAAKLIELLPRSFRLSQAGVPGPVIFSLPEDMLRDDVGDDEAVTYPLPVLGAGEHEWPRIQEMIGQAERPLIIAGARLRGAAGAEALHRFASGQRIPVAVTWKSQDVFDNGSDLFAGHLTPGTTAAQRKILGEADLIIAVGTRLGDFATLGFTLPEAPVPKQRLIHIYPDAAPIGKVIRADLGVVADPVALLAGLSHAVRVGSALRERWVSDVHSATVTAQDFKTVDPDDGIDFGVVTKALEKFAPQDVIITTDAGNMSTWHHRFWKMTPKQNLLGVIAGAMGFGVPAAVAAQLVLPARMALCFVGDGGILMTGNELATAKAFGAAPKIVLSNNGIYGTIRSHQEKSYATRVSGTNLVNPDFTAWGKSFGIEVFDLNLGDDVDAVVQAFLASEGAALLHVKSSKIALSAG
ncbi:MAG: acetolactate synthase, partial [Alphaproteobacteria bacterium]|nr:acetolactate synthase [Alphaproteobacteria bacterium]